MTVRGGLIPFDDAMMRLVFQDCHTGTWRHSGLSSRRLNFRPPRVHTAEFRQEAQRLLERSGKREAEAGQELGVIPGLLHKRFSSKVFENFQPRFARTSVNI